MKIVAIINIFNEEMILQQSLDHLVEQGIDFYIVNNGSTDRSMEIVHSFTGGGLVGCESLKYNEIYHHAKLMKRKEQLAMILPADWILHCDADEFRTSNMPDETLADAIKRIDQSGFNAVNFQECTFIATEAHPHHDFGSFVETMRWYYPFLPAPLHRVNAWKKSGAAVELASSGGHRVHFNGISIYPESLWLRHYLYINRDHFMKKYSKRRHDEDEIKRGWHGWRDNLDETLFYCPPESSMRIFDPACPWKMDASEPLTKHMLESVMS